MFLRPSEKEFMSQFSKLEKKEDEIQKEDLEVACKNISQTNLTKLLVKAIEFKIADNAMEYIINLAGEKNCLNKENKEGFTALHAAAKQNREKWVIALLKQEKINSQVKNSAGKMPLDYAKDGTTLKKILSTPYKDILHLIEESKTEPSIELLENTLAKNVALHVEPGKISQGLTAMHLATIRSFPAVVQFLHKNGWNINIKHGWYTPLELYIRYLIMGKVDRWIVGTETEDAVKEMLIALIKCGASTNRKLYVHSGYYPFKTDDQFETIPKWATIYAEYSYIYDIAKQCNSKYSFKQSTLELIKPKPIPYYVIEQLGINNQDEVIDEVAKAVKDYPGYLKYTGYDGYNAFLKAVSFGYKNIAAYLVSVDPALLNSKAYYYERTALMVAAEHGYNDIVTWLIEEGADKSVKDSFGFTAADHAKRNKKEACLETIRNTYKKQPPLEYNPEYTVPKPSAPLVISSASADAKLLLSIPVDTKPLSTLKTDEAKCLPASCESIYPDVTLIASHSPKMTGDVPSKPCSDEIKIEPLSLSSQSPQSFAQLLAELYIHQLYQYIKVIAKPADPAEQKLLSYFQQLPQNNMAISEMIKCTFDFFDKDDMSGLLELLSTLADKEYPSPSACFYYAELALRKADAVEVNGEQMKQPYIRIAQMQYEKIYNELISNTQYHSANDFFVELEKNLSVSKSDAYTAIIRNLEKIKNSGIKNDDLIKKFKMLDWMMLKKHQPNISANHSLFKISKQENMDISGIKSPEVPLQDSMFVVKKLNS